MVAEHQIAANSSRLLPAKNLDEKMAAI